MNKLLTHLDTTNENTPLGVFSFAGAEGIEPSVQVLETCGLPLTDAPNSDTTTCAFAKNCNIKISGNYQPSRSFVSRYFCDKLLLMSKKRYYLIAILVTVVLATGLLMFQFRDQLFPPTFTSVSAEQISNLYPELSFTEATDDNRPIFFQSYQPLLTIESTAQNDSRSFSPNGLLWVAETAVDPGQDVNASASGQPALSPEKFITAADQYLTAQGFSKSLEINGDRLNTQDMQSPFGSVSGYLRLVNDKVQMIEVMAFANLAPPSDENASTGSQCPCSYGIFVSEQLAEQQIFP